MSETWNRDGDLLYTLEHAGWRKGEEQFRNRLTVRVEAAPGSTETKEEATMVLDLEVVYEALTMIPELFIPTEALHSVMEV